jgi:N-acetylglutamate synthase-like GNAT family acetyltransferase
MNADQAMTALPKIESERDLSPSDIAAVEEGLYRYNREATGRHDGQGLAFVMRDDERRIVAAAAGYSWAGIAELRQMWVHENIRGRGHGKALLTAFIAEAQRRGVKRIWVASYDFQAPALYEKFGFRRVVELPGMPDGHCSVILCKEFTVP